MRKTSGVAGVEFIAAGVFSMTEREPSGWRVSAGQSCPAFRAW
jgi:hypothetical protein